MAGTTDLHHSHTAEKLLVACRQKHSFQVPVFVCCLPPCRLAYLTLTPSDLKASTSSSKLPPTVMGRSYSALQEHGLNPFPTKPPCTALKKIAAIFLRRPIPP